MRPYFGTNIMYSTSFDKLRRFHLLLYKESEIEEGYYA